ncbi:hypothetical protein FSP39_012654 [Pinctada imbricata]|uniref:PDZ domain-containing protein n=1 Tax=Pinctada imbricata TaxID=66713 RepID=A0AA89BZP5_PINIB|nr:hypothetical protein FSP39_012654 [Pinctada imbricata]
MKDLTGLLCCLGLGEKHSVLSIKEKLWENIIVTKVNGQDLSQATHEEAVEAFRAAKEPIVVEVLRRVNKSKMKTQPPAMVSIGTQTEEDIYGFGRPPTPPPPIFAFSPHGLYQAGTRRPVAFSPNTDMGLTDIEMAQGLDYDDPYFDDRVYEMEYEEVILHRTATEQKLGLTLCYGSLDDGTTDIFISEVEQGSIAGQDGRIREGDQILQINGIDVHSRDQAIKLFSERGSDIKLLLARPQQLDDGFMEDQNVTLDDLHMDILEKHHHDNMQIMASMLARGHIDEEGGTTDTATTENSLHKHEKDSGVGRTDESTKNDESSEQDLFDTECTNSPAATQKFKNYRKEKLYSDESVLSNEVTDHDIIVNEFSAEECENFRQYIERRCNSSLENSPRKDGQRKNSLNSIDKELAMLDKEMENIHLECQEMCDRHIQSQSKLQSPKDTPGKSPRIVPRMGTRLEYLKHVQSYDQANTWDRKDTLPKLGAQPGKSHPDKDASTTTSAYNTGESCRSTPLTLELNQASDESEKGFKNSMLCLAPTNIPSPSDTEKQTQTPCRSSQDASSDDNTLSMVTQNTDSAAFKQQSCMGESLQDLYMQYADVMYTNQANLQHTIAIQQKLFQQQIEQKHLSQRSKNRSSAGSPSVSGNLSLSNKQGENSPNATPPDSSSQMEWVVKRRPDGTRYITRRPVRSKLLKERARKISEERCGMTTDDDAMSELKVGRYWSKEDRKRHLEKARDHKKKREGLMRAKMETLKEAEEKKEVNIVELSHRKMMKHKGKKVLDNFMTIQEMLAHGSRVAEGKAYNPLLSVTTV